MRKSRFTGARLIGLIQEREAGLSTSEPGWTQGLSPATSYKLKARSGGLNLSNAERLRQLGDENAKSKRRNGRLTVIRRRPAQGALAAGPRAAADLAELEVPVERPPEAAPREG
jgi:putative transposase